MILPILPILLPIPPHWEPAALALSLSLALCLSLLLQLPCVHQLLFHFYVASLVSFNFYFYFCMASVCSSWLSVCSSTSISLLYGSFTSLHYTSRTAIFFFVVVRPSCNLQRSDSGAVAFATAASRWCHEEQLGLSDCRYCLFLFNCPKKNVILGSFSIFL